MLVPRGVFIAVCCLAIAVAGCTREAGQGPSSASADNPLRLAFVTNNGATFWTIARAGCEEAAREAGNVSLDFRIPSTGGAAEQQQILDDLIAAGVDGIAVSPIDPANQTEFLKRIAAQTLLICHDSDAPASQRVTYIGTDNTAAGVEAGKLIKQALPEGGKIMLFVGSVDAQNAKERMAGIRQELAGSNVEILDVRTDETDPIRAQKNVEDTLVTNPEIACLVGLWAYNGPAILNAVRSAGVAGKVKIVCFDENAETLEGVAAGDIFGTVVQQPFEFGKQAISRMASHLQGDATALAEPVMIIPTRVLKQPDVAEFETNLKRILGQSPSDGP